jgi:hypothetical protein
VERDVCTKDSDCCGAAAFADAGLPTSGNPVTCTGGYCTQHMGCTPTGDVCKLPTVSCNANANCCAGLGNFGGVCKQDNLGIPRCSVVGCVDAGGACASSADCCNGDPCVPNPGGSPPYTCGATTCVQNCGSCSTTADCCPGSTCLEGVCGPCGGNTFDSGTPPPPDAGVEAGPTCSQYGQLCGDAGLTCCAGLTCINTSTGARCELP